MMTTDDPKLQKQIKGTLAQYEDQSALRPPDFSAYRAIVEKDIREGRPAPVGLVEHMYYVDPGVALLAMAEAFPASEFHGYDPSSIAIERTRAKADAIASLCATRTEKNMT